MKRTLKIMIKSDLCAGSGHSFAGVIDTDVVFDEFGIPYIPARRIKGCLRDAAELIGIKEIDQMFGKSGENRPGMLYISDAMVKDYTKVREDCQKAIAAGRITREGIMDAFSYVRGQTKIDEQKGIAAENTLRYTRVIKQKSPIDNEDMVFFSETSFDGKAENLEQAAKALRNMGMSRNRGLGSVRCDASEESNGNKSIKCTIHDEDNTLRYVITNTSALMLSGSKNEVSERYLSGKAILGALAAEYLREEGNSSEDPIFQNLFLNDCTWFSNAYPAYLAGEDWKRCYPAPLYIKELKKTKKTINTLKMKKDTVLTNPKEEHRESDPYDPRGGNQPKKLKGKYWDFQNHKKLEVLTDVSYHHTRSKCGEEGKLYTMEVIPRGRYFSGEIHGSNESIRKLAMLLEGADLRFGKSKSAQYGACALIASKACKAAGKYDVTGKIVVTLLSDAVFCDENGYITEFGNVSKKIAKELGIAEKANVCRDECVYETVMRTGYNTQWNLSSPLIPAIAAGSAFTFDLGDQKAQIDVYGRLGEYAREGCGEYRIDELSEMSERPAEKECPNRSEPEGTGEETNDSQYPFIGSISRDKL